MTPGLDRQASTEMSGSVHQLSAAGRHMGCVQAHVGVRGLKEVLTSKSHKECRGGNRVGIVSRRSDSRECDGPRSWCGYEAHREWQEGNSGHGGN